MKGCFKCSQLYRDDHFKCPQCQGVLEELSLQEALDFTRKKSFHDHMAASDITDTYRQYLIRSYLGDRSLFLLYDLSLNRLKHGLKPKRFFIQPVDFTAVFNIPWFVFNVVSSNIFHLKYVEFCAKCQCKTIPHEHTDEECRYNIAYFNILNDILSGEIVKTKSVYLQHALETVKLKERSAYVDLFMRRVRFEIIFDFLSIGLSVFFWIYMLVFISYPMCELLLQQI